MYARILVPVDGSPTAERGLGEAIELAAQLKSRLILLCVVAGHPSMSEIYSSATLEDMRRQSLKFGDDILEAGRKRATQAGLECESVLREVSSERIADVVIEEALKRQCALIVMGTHGRRGLSRLALGSDAEMVLRDAPVPVLLVRRGRPVAA